MKLTRKEGEDIRDVVTWLIAYWPNLERELSRPKHADNPDSHPIYAAAKRISEELCEDEWGE